MNTISEMADDVVELEEIATTKVLTKILGELNAYRDALGHEPSAYALFLKQMMGRGGVNNALDRFNNKRRGLGRPIVGIKNLRHRGVPLIVRSDP